MSPVPPMANPFRNLPKQKLLRTAPARARWALVGLAHDFWEDGARNPVQELFKRLPLPKIPLPKIPGTTAGLPKSPLGQTDVGKTDLGKTDLGKTDLRKTDLGKIDLGKIDLGKIGLDKMGLGKLKGLGNLALEGQAFLKKTVQDKLARKGAVSSAKGVEEAPPPKTSPETPVLAAQTSVPALWHAMPGEVAEKMWGKSFVLPGGVAMLDMLLRPIGMDQDTEVLDLSAGLGGFMARAFEIGSFATGLEADPALAIRANELMIENGIKADPITYYTPDAFNPNKTVGRLYDCVIAREIFYRLTDKPKFFTSVAIATKPQAQLTFTDYIINPEDRLNPAVKAWKNYEGGVAPLSLVEMAEAWAQAGFKLAVHDDQTHFYRHEVLTGLKNLAHFLARSPKPDDHTRRDIARRMEVWTHRLAALENGMKFFRFYGTKESGLPQTR